MPKLSADRVKEIGRTLLIAAGAAAWSARIALACVLIIGGAALAARDLWRPVQKSGA